MSSKSDSQWIWVNGRLVAYADAKVPLLSHSLHYGCAVFEGIRAYRTQGGKPGVFRATEHYRRFLTSMQSLGYRSEFSVETFLSATAEVIRKNAFVDCYLRPIAFLGDGFRGLKLPERVEAEIAIAAWQWGKYLGDEGQTKGIKVAVSSYRRPDVSSSLPLAKSSGNYLTSVLARREASRHGCDEALLLDPQGYVAEGSGENLFLVKDGILYTPPPGSILPGITRDSVMQIARSMGYEVRERLITRNEVYLADELFFTGTAVEVTGIREVDGYPIGDSAVGPITKALSERFFACVRGEVPEFRHWVLEV